MPDLVTTDGVRLAYEVDGTAPAPPVVLLHGLGSDSAAAGPLIEAVGGRLHVARLDFRGHGRSDALDDPARYGWFARAAADVVELLDRLGWERAHVAGGSLGAAVALATALAAPARVRSLTLLTPAIGAGRAFSANPRVAAAVHDPAVAERPEFSGQDRRAMRACLAALRGAVLVDDLAELVKVTVPTLVIGRPRDPHHPLAVAHDIAAAIPGARRIDDDTGRPPLWERPVELAAILIGFVTSVERAGGR